jgi:hypothetical protein
VSKLRSLPGRIKNEWNTKASTMDRKIFLTPMKALNSDNQIHNIIFLRV